MKKIFLFLALVLAQSSFSQMNLVVTGFGGTGNCDGSFKFGTCPFATYNISGSNGFVWTFPSTSVSNLCPATYAITMADMSGNSYQYSFTYTTNGQVILGTASASLTVFSSFASVTPSSMSPPNCNGSIVLDIQGGTPPYTIVWKDSLSQIISGQSNDTLNNVCPNGYSFSVTDNSSFCSGGANVVLLMATGIDKYIEVKDFTVYPNPANNKITIKNINLLSNEYVIEIFSLDGKLIRNETIIKNEIDVTDLQSGMYFVQLKNKAQLYNFKFIKE